MRVRVRACVRALSLCKKLASAFIRDCERAIKQIRMEFHDEKGTRSRARSSSRKLQRLRAIDEKASFENTGLLQN